MGKASQVLPQRGDPGVRTRYHALADYGEVPYSTVHRAFGRRLIENQAKSQRYPTP
jgi:hypothetical protein